jgi:hypothetical protein
MHDADPHERVRLVGRGLGVAMHAARAEGEDQYRWQ